MLHVLPNTIPYTSCNLMYSLVTFLSQTCCPTSQSTHTDPVMQVSSFSNHLQDEFHSYEQYEGLRLHIPDVYYMLHIWLSKIIKI